LSALTKAGRFLLKEFHHILPPTIYFFCAFNIIAFNSNLMVRHYWFALSNFLLATTLALIVGKVILVTDKFRFLDRFRGRPLYRPILFKTVFYSLMVGLVRVVEQLLHVVFDERGVNVAFNAALDAFTWQRFTAVQIWLLVCFLVYVTVTELSALSQRKFTNILLRRG
jgi:hypothetical protein